jgi:hypothetical protein
MRDGFGWAITINGPSPQEVSGFRVVPVYMSPTPFIRPVYSPMNKSMHNTHRHHYTFSNTVSDNTL